MIGVIDLSKGFPSTIFLSGIYLATFAASGVFFFKYWKKTHERFFYFFALACWMLAAERLPFLWVNPTDEPNSWLYLLRLTAFGLIICAVVRANEAKRT